MGVRECTTREASSSALLASFPVHQRSRLSYISHSLVLGRLISHGPGHYRGIHVANLDTRNPPPSPKIEMKSKYSVDSFVDIYRPLDRMGIIVENARSKSSLAVSRTHAIRPFDASVVWKTIFADSLGSLIGVRLTKH